ncbi:MAG: glycosyltransferase family 2 protein [Myxococcota bacterium]
MSAAGSAREPVSVCMLACDEERELERALASVAWADEIVVVVDAKSRDGSEAVARRLASRVERRAYAGDVEQKRFAVSLAQHDWAFILDPDEVVTPVLAEAMRSALARTAGAGGGGRSAGDEVVAYEIDRSTWHLGRWIRHGDFHPDWKLRLFRRSCARFVGRDPHGRVEVDGRVARLEGELLHYSYRDLADQIARIQFFSGEAAAALAREGARAGWRQLLFHPPARFLRSYVLRRGFLDGMPGFVIAVASGFYVFLKYAKLWERTRTASGDDLAQGPGTAPRA